MTVPGDAQKEPFPEVLTIEQAARYLQLHPQVVYRHVRAGTLPASRIGRTIRFKKSVLDDFLEKSGWASVHAYLKYKERVLEETAEGASRRRRFSAEVD